MKITYISPNTGLTNVAAFYTVAATALSVSLAEVSPGQYEGELPTDTPPGTYLLTIKEGAVICGYGEYATGGGWTGGTPGQPLSGSYANFEEVILRFEEKETLDVSVAKRSRPVPSQYNQPRVEASLRDATSLINSYIGSRYDLTPLLASPSGELKRHTVNIARFYLAQHRDPELYRYLYEEAIKWCESALIDGRSLVTGSGVRVPQFPAGSEGGDPDTGIVTRAAAYSHNSPARSFSQQGFSAQRNAGLGYGRRFR